MKFNEKKVSNAEQTKTVNYEGGLAFTVNPKLELVIRSATCLVNEPKFYVKDSEDETAIKELVAKVVVNDAEFPLKLAAYARNTLYLRSLPTMLLIECLQYNQCKKYVRKWMPKILMRADEVTEALALFITKNGDIGTNGKGSMPHCFRNGLVDCIRNFSPYSIAKYDSSKNKVRYRDALRLLHPAPIDEAEDKLFKDIINDTLATPETWETYISGKGSTKENWEHIIPKMGYMALMRNLRNFIDKGVNTEAMNKVLSTLTNKDEVRKSKQFPFRFYSAYREIQKLEMYGDPFTTKEVLRALNTAIQLSVANVDKLPGRTAIFVDNSGSMSVGKVSRMSTVTAKDVAGVMGALSYAISDNPVLGVFADQFKLVNVDGMGVLDAANRVVNTEVGGSTYGYKAIQYLNENKIVVDRIIILSDMQLYNEGEGNGSGYSGYIYGYSSYGTVYGEFKKYRENVNANAKLYSIDLCGYGTAAFPEKTKGVVLLAGWSDRILQFIRVYEGALEAKVMVNAIENYE